MVKRIIFLQSDLSKVMKLKSVFIFYSFFFLLLICLTVSLTFWLTLTQSLRLVWSFVYILFFPGFIWSWIIWKPCEIEEIHRIILAITLSFATVPLFMLIVNRLGLPINAMNSFLTTSLFILVGVSIMAIRIISFHKKSL